MRKQGLLWMGLVVCSVLVAAGGCRLFSGPDAPKPVIYTQENPGPWKDAMPQGPAVTVVGLKLTVKVDYKSRTDDYVDRITAKDDQGRDVGELAFDAASTPEVTFALPRGTRSVTVLVHSTKNGLWSSKPIAVPDVPAEKEK